MKTFVANAIGLAALALLSGCYAPVQDSNPSAAAAPPSPVALPPAGPQQVSVDGRWTFSAYENPPAVNWLIDRARTATGDGSRSLGALVQRWPDVTLELLRESLGADSDVPLRLSLADAYDRAFGTSDPSAGWSAALAATASRRGTFAALGQRCNQLLTLFHSAQFAQAAKIDPIDAVPAGTPPALWAEALRLAGLSALLNDRPDRAAELFTRALLCAEKGPRHPRFEIGLLLCESRRRSGQNDLAANAWNAAILSATDVRDPNLWDRAILAKPPNVAWPYVRDIAGPGEPDFGPGIAPDTGDVLIGIGKMDLSRAAPEPALLAFSRAEAETTVPGKKALARLLRAQCMISMQQAASAIPMLEALVKSDDPKIAWRAQAIEGDVMCHGLDDRQHGIPLMRDALRNSNTFDWPGKSRLIANLGLYCLLEGGQDEGLRDLHQAQARFTAEAKWEDLAGSLKNEAAYLRVIEKPDAADAVQKRADDASRKAGLAPGPLTAQTSDDPPVTP